jgi:uncharacterized protein
MKYRKFGKLDWDVSVFGFGAMRLPTPYGDSSKIDSAETIRSVRYAINHGVNYLDFDPNYSMKPYEHIIRNISRALEGGYRKKTKIAAGMPSSLLNTASHFDHYLDAQLEWLQTDQVDFFLIGGLNRETWPGVRETKALSWLEKAMSEGRIGKIGFSFHDQYQYLRNILEAYDNWTLCQFQYSYMDVDHHPGASGLKLAADKGLAVIVSEPLKWGRLTKRPPEPVARVWANASPKRTLADWGLRWVWNHPEVSTMVIDMDSLEQLKETIALADRISVDSLSIQEEVIISQVREEYRKLRPVNCTACRSCMPCPQDIDVPRLFELYNDAVMYDDVEVPQFLFRNEEHCLENCNECGVCMQTCGREIKIPDRLKDAKRRLTNT